MSSRPQIFYNSVTNRWEVLSKGGKLTASVRDDGIVELHRSGILANFTGTIANLSVGSTAELRRVAIGGGTTLTKMYKIVGSAAAISLGTYGVSIGSIYAEGVLANDVVLASCRTAVPSLGVSGFRVSGSNNVNFAAVNPYGDIASLPTATWDVTAIRA